MCVCVCVSTRFMKTLFPQGMGFICKVLAIVDILLAFNQLSQLDTDNAQFSLEVESSRSTIQAVKSGQSVPLV